MAMKLVMAIVQAADSRKMLDDLMAEGYRATKISTTSGLLRRGNATILIGVQDQQLEGLLSLLRRHAHGRQEFVSSLKPRSRGTVPAPRTKPVQVEVSGMTIFVFDVERAERLPAR
ncbi:MAG: hypothetical protein FJ026_02615 [Chloroflexi bacterium]|nr:hypothetical protein [Chloroflexota bacterium]